MPGLADAPPLFLYPLLAGLFLGLLQIVLYFVGGDGGEHALADMLEGSGAGEWFDWLNFGRVPFSILCMLLLASFGAVGMALSGFVPVWIGALAALPMAVGSTKLVGNGLARLLPRDESYAVNTDQLVGRRGVVTLGPLDDGHPGNVRVRDAHGELHTLRARPADPGTVIAGGTEVVIVSESGPGRVFLVIPFDPGA